MGFVKVFHQLIVFRKLIPLKWVIPIAVLILQVLVVPNSPCLLMVLVLILMLMFPFSLVLSWLQHQQSQRTVEVILPLSTLLELLLLQYTMLLVAAYLLTTDSHTPHSFF